MHSGKSWNIFFENVSVTMTPDDNTSRFHFFTENTASSNCFHQLNPFYGWSSRGSCAGPANEALSTLFVPE